LEQGEDRSKMCPSRGCMGPCQAGVAAPPHPELPRRRILDFARKIQIPSNTAKTTIAEKEG